MRHTLSSLLDRVLKGGLLLKGATGVLEFLGGLLLFFVDPAAIYKFITLLAQKELLEDPRDKVANLLMLLTQGFGAGSRAFLIIYLWVHAVIKLIAVIGILKHQLWAYPFSLIALGALTMYQLYSIIFVSPSIGMIALTVFDVAILWLIWRDYHNIKLSHQAAPTDTPSSAQ